MIERHKSLDWYSGYRAAIVDLRNGGELDYDTAKVTHEIVDSREAEVMDAMAEAACTCGLGSGLVESAIEGCPVHGGAK